MPNIKNEFKTNLIIFAVSEAILIVYTIIHWWLWGRDGFIGLSDTLFIVSTVFMCAGLLIAITNTSRKHYYKHIKAQFQGKNPDERRYEEEKEKRLKFTGHGGAISVAGVLGIIICTIITYSTF